MTHCSSTIDWSTLGHLAKYAVQGKYWYGKLTFWCGFVSWRIAWLKIKRKTSYTEGTHSSKPQRSVMM